MELPVEGGRLYVEEHGTGGVPLLLIQGLGYGIWGWRDQLPAFAAPRRTIAFDNRGAGRSSKEPGPFSMDQFAGDALSVLDALGVESAHVLGVSRWAIDPTVTARIASAGGQMRSASSIPSGVGQFRNGSST